MANLFARQIVLELAVAHAGEIVPALVVVGGVLDAEMPKLVGVVAALGRAMESGVLRTLYGRKASRWDRAQPPSHLRLTRMSTNFGRYSNAFDIAGPKSMGA